MPHDDRPLKLCWACVLEGAVPLPDSLLEEEEDEHNQRTIISLSPNTARGIAEDDNVSPSVAVVNLATSAAAAEAGGAYVAPQPPSPFSRHDRAGARARECDDERRRGAKKKEGSGFLSALVSLIEVVASPTSPARSRGGGGGLGGPGGATAGTARPPALTTATSMDEAGNETTRTPMGTGGANRETAGGDSSPLLLRKEYDSESASRTQMLEAEGGGFPSPSTAGFLTESGDDLSRYGGGGVGVENGLEGRGLEVLYDEKPVELGFPSERPWAHGFGS